MKMLRSRKNLRLKDFDYSQSGYYFVTICTKNRSKLLSNIVGDGFHAVPCHAIPTRIGDEIIKTINFIDNQHSNVCFDKYIIMPNHIHLIIILQESKTGGHGNPPLHKIIGQLKSYTNKRYNDINKAKGSILWQRNYFEHIIRSEHEYQEIWQYIEINPIEWKEDEYYC
ncbi:MAG TPA: transposase [Clostridia bacterium]|nr:transposase [Clostridia bacterium]